MSTSAYFGSHTTTVDINATKSIVAIVVLAVIGPCMFILQPVYVQGLVEYLQFSDKQAGFIASAEMFGLATMAIAVNFVLNRINWRLLSILFLVIATAGNYLSVNTDNTHTLMAIRYITGLGSGGLISITFTMMGLTQRAERNMGYIVASLLTYGALGLLVMPTAFQVIGVNGVLIFFAIFCTSGLIFVGYLPCSAQTTQKQTSINKQYTWPTKLIALTGVLMYNLAIGIVWVYLFLVGIEASISEQTVANALTVSQFLGIAGAMIAVIFEVRFGQMLPLLVGVIGSALGIALILGTPSFILYTTGVCFFNFLWNLTMPYLMAMLANYDAQGRIVSVGVALQMLGYAIGPAIAASLLSMGGYNLVNSIAIVLLIISALLFIPGLRVQMYAKKQPSDSIL